MTSSRTAAVDIPEHVVPYPVNVTDGTPHNATNNRLPIEEYQFYIFCIVGGPVAVLGIIGNILSIFVLSSWRMRSPTSCYLIALAVFDIIVLISMVLCFSLPIYSRTMGQFLWYNQNYPYINSYAYFMALTAQTCSIYTTVAFTAERYIAVCRPLLATKLCTIKRARKSVLIIILCAVIYNIPRFFEHTVGYRFDNTTNMSVPEMQLTKLGGSHAYRQVYFIYLQLCVMFVVPSCILVVLNSLLIRAVKLSRQTQGRICSSSSTNSVRRDNNLTVMLISVIFVFLICQMPSIADNICYATLDFETLETLPFFILNGMGTLMVIINSAANFYLYCLFGKKFRRVFCRVFCQCYFILTMQDPNTDSFVQVSTMRTAVSRRNNGAGHQNSASCKKRYSGMMVVMNDGTSSSSGGGRASTGTVAVNGSATKYTKMKEQTQL